MSYTVSTLAQIGGKGVTAGVTRRSDKTPHDLRKKVWAGRFALWRCRSRILVFA
jgi:hypothetical protein